MSTALATRPEESDAVISAALKSQLVKMDVHKATFICAIGAQMGIPPALALNQVHLVRDKIIIGASIQASLVASSRRYSFRVRELTDTSVSIAFRERTLDGQGWEEIGVSTYTIEDAKKAGLTGKDVWKAHPRNMLYARAMTNGVRWFTPDLLGGAVYDEYELDASSSVSVQAAEPQRAAAAPPIDMIEVVAEPPAPAPAAKKSAKRRLYEASQAIAAHVQAPVEEVGPAILARFELTNSGEIETCGEPRRTQILADCEASAADEMRARRWWASLQRAPRDWATVNGELHALLTSLCGGWEKLDPEFAKEAVHGVTRARCGLPDAPWTQIPPHELELTVAHLRRLDQIDEREEFIAEWNAWTGATLATT